MHGLIPIPHSTTSEKDARCMSRIFCTRLSNSIHILQHNLMHRPCVCEHFGHLNPSTQRTLTRYCRQTSSVPNRFMKSRWTQDTPLSLTQGTVDSQGCQAIMPVFRIIGNSGGRYVGGGDFIRTVWRSETGKTSCHGPRERQHESP